MMKTNIEGARVKVVAYFRPEGSVLAETIQGRCDRIEPRLEVSSIDSPERVAALVRNAERGCYLMQLTRNPTTIVSEVVLNGEILDLGSSSSA